jgi:hypothetical protein
MKTFVIAPTFASADYWCRLKGIDTRSSNVCVITRPEQLRTINLQQLKQSGVTYRNFIIIYGYDYRFPENILDVEDYHQFKILIRRVEKVFYEQN